MPPTDEDIEAEFARTMTIGVDLARGKDMTSIATYGAATASTGHPQQAFNLASLRRAAALIEEHEAENRRRTIADMAAGLFTNPPFGPLRFVENPLATTSKPVKVHKRRRNQTLAYHQRIQKKWNKRFGHHLAPSVFQLDGGKFGLGSMFVVHPEIAKRLRAASETPIDDCLKW